MVWLLKVTQLVLGIMNGSESIYPGALGMGVLFNSIMLSGKLMCIVLSIFRLRIYISEIQIGREIIPCCGAKTLINLIRMQHLDTMADGDGCYMMQILGLD